MSTAGSVRSGEKSAYLPPRPGEQNPGVARTVRTRLLRWQGIVPLLLGLAIVFGGWMLFGDRIIRNTISEAGTKALGAQLDIGGLTIHTISTSVDLRDVALADPFDHNRNLFEVGRVVVELEPLPLLEKKLVVKRLAISDVRTGTRRAVPAAAVTAGGFAPSALAEVRRFSEQFKVPLLSLVPIDSLKALILNPADLKAVQAALAVGREADSTRQAIQSGFAELRLQETLDSSAALVARLQATNIRTLGLDGARTAVADLRRAAARVDSTRSRVDRLAANARQGAEAIQTGIRGIDEARREDYEHARSLLRLPSVDAPDIGAALFGAVTIDKFQQAVYWATLARQYAPPGLLPRESQGPKRVRMAGTTVHFATPASYPRFLLRRADVNVATSAGAGDTYTMAASDVTTDPGIVGRPTLFAVRRRGRGGQDSVRVIGSMDHTGARPREVVSASAAGLRLPTLPLPSLPYRMDPGAGSSDMRFVLDGDQISGTWTVRSTTLSWSLDSTRARKLNTIESLVTRVLTGVRSLDITADVSGTLEAPRLAVRSNLDRQVAEQLKAVAGREIAAATARMRAQVDRLVDERSAPVIARAEEIRAEGERKVADARSRLDEEKRKLDERLKALSGGALALPIRPGN